VELTGTQENECDGFMSEDGAERRVWIERALLEFQDKDVNLVGRAAVCVPHFAVVAPLLQVTDMVATLPRRLALCLTAQSPVVLLDLPYSPIYCGCGDGLESKDASGYGPAMADTGTGFIRCGFHLKSSV